MLFSLYCQNQPASAPLLASLRTTLSHGSAATLPRAAVLCLGPMASAFASCSHDASSGTAPIIALHSSALKARMFHLKCVNDCHDML